jgi:hypothetical protein
MASRISQLKWMQELEADQEDEEHMEEIHTACHTSHQGRRHHMCRLCQEDELLDGLVELAIQQIQEWEFIHPSFCPNLYSDHFCASQRFEH